MCYTRAMNAPLLLIVSVLAASPVKVAVMPLQPGAGVKAETAQTLTNVVVAETRRARNVSVITQDEIATVLTLDQQRQLLGCQDNDKCRAEAGSALGVDHMLMGSVSKLGGSWLLHLKLLEVSTVKTLKEVDRRQKGGNADDLLDALPAMVASLMEVEKMAPGAPVSKGGTPPVASAAQVAHTADEDMDKANVAALSWSTDGKGRYFAYSGWGKDWPLYAGDGTLMVAQRTTGGSRNGKKFDWVFWEPRAKDRWMAGFGTDEATKPWLRCGKDKTALQALSAKQAAAMTRKARFVYPQWRRYPWALVRDDLGTYYLVDGVRGRDMRTDGRKDLRLYIGKKKQLVLASVNDVLTDRTEDVLLTPTGRLKLDYKEKKASWVEGQVETALKWLEPEAEAATIYTDLGVYPAALGTACDGRW